MTKEQLREYQNIKREAEQLQTMIEELEAPLYSPKSQQLTGMPHAPARGNASENMADKHLELLDRYRAKLRELNTARLLIEDAIDCLESVDRRLLRLRYIDGLTWEAVCVLMDYSWRQVHRRHAKALEKLKEKKPGA